MPELLKVVFEVKKFVEVLVEWGTKVVGSSALSKQHELVRLFMRKTSVNNQNVQNLNKLYLMNECVSVLSVGD